MFRRDVNSILSEELGDAYGRYRELWEQVSSFSRSTRTPLHIDFELNYSCNLKCITCPHGIPGAPEPSYARDKMDFSLFKTIIDEGVQKDLKAIRLSQLNEPLLRKDLPDFIDYAKTAGVIDIMINTNAMLLDRETVHRLMEAGLTQLKVSIDAATPETYNKIRIGGDYDRVIRNVKEFIKIRQQLKSRLPILRVSFVKTADNVHETQKFLDTWENVADYCAVSDYSNWVEEDPDSEAKFAAGQPVTHAQFHCEQPWLRATVFANGDIIPCCAEYFRYQPVGNLREQGLEQVWTSPKLQALRQLHKKGDWENHPLCKKCILNSSICRTET